MKKIISLVLCFILVCACVPMSIFADEQSATVVYGESIVIDGCTLVPARQVADTFNLELNMDTYNTTLTDNTKNIEIKFTIGSNEAYVNGISTTLDVAPMILNDRTYVPLNFIESALNTTVEWKEENNDPQNTTTSAPSGVQTATVTINGKSIDTITEHGRVLVPLKIAADSLGLLYSYNDSTTLITLTDVAKGITLNMYIDSEEINLNGMSIMLDAAPKLINNQVYIPLKVLTEAFQADVEWNGNSTGQDTTDIDIKDDPSQPIKPLSPLHIEFTDVSTDSPNARAIDALTELGVLAGYEDKTFKPESTITRAEFATVICRFINKATEAQGMKGVTNFQDVSSEHWANGYINYAFQNGIISGIGDGLFAPEENVTQIQAIKMILGAGGYVTDYPQGYANLATNMFIWDNANESDIPLTRELAAKYLYNALTVTVNDNDPIKGKRFIDVLVGPIEMDPVLKEAVIESLNSGIIHQGGIITPSTVDKSIFPQNLSDNIYLYQLAYVTGIRVDDTNTEHISSLNGIQYMPNLTLLDIKYQDIKDLSPLSEINRWAYEFLPRFSEPEITISLYGNFDIENIEPLRQEKFSIVSYPCLKYSGIDIEQYATYKKGIDNISIDIGASDKYNVCGELFISLLLDNNSIENAVKQVPSLTKEISELDIALQTKDKFYLCSSILLHYPQEDMPLSDKIKLIIECIQKAQQIVDENTNANMSDREKVKIIHDYMVNNCEYDYVSYENSKNDDDF